MQKKQSTTILLCVVLVIFVAFLSGCIDYNMEPPANASNEIVIGALLPLTGDLSFSGQAARAVLEMADEDVNAFLFEQENGMKVRLAIEDTETNPGGRIRKNQETERVGCDIHNWYRLQRRA